MNGLDILENLFIRKINATQDSSQLLLLGCSHTPYPLLGNLQCQRTHSVPISHLSSETQTIPCIWGSDTEFFKKELLTIPFSLSAALTICLPSSNM